MAAFLNPKFISTFYLLSSNTQKNNAAYDIPKQAPIVPEPVHKDMLQLDAKCDNHDWDVTAPIKKGLSGLIVGSLRGKGPEIIKQAFKAADKEANPELYESQDSSHELETSQKREKTAIRRVTAEVLDEAIETVFKKIGINSRSVTAAVATTAFAGTAMRGARIFTTTGNVVPLALSLVGTFASSKATEFFAKQSQNKTHVERLAEEDDPERSL